MITRKREIGNLGEELVSKFLVKQGHKVLDRNYLKKWGELDIVTREKDLMHFIEVKTIVAHENKSDFSFTEEDKDSSVSQFTFKIEFSRENEDSSETGDDYLPEDNVHYWKQKRIIRAIQTYLMEKNVNEDQEWQIDIAVVRLDFFDKIAKIKLINNVVFEV